MQSRSLVLTRIVAGAFLLLTFAVAGVRGEAPFALSAQGSSFSASATGSNLVDLFGNLVTSEGEFAPLTGSTFTAALRYGEMENAIRLTRNAAGTGATLTIPSTGFARTFVAANADDLENQVQEFSEKEGAGAYAAFLAEVGRQTSFGVNDGNPLSTTAILADLGFYRFGYRPRSTSDAPIELPGGWDIRLLGGVSDTDAFEGWFAGLGIGKNWRLSDRVGITWA